MKLDIILAGVGGQGILSIAKVIGDAALEAGLYLKQSEVHGMSQRGGDVQSHLRIADHEIYSDLIPPGTADIILSVEPMEALRYLPYLSPNGYIVTNTKPYNNIVNYPEVEAILAEIKKQPRHLLLDADGMAHELKNPRGMNMVMTGAASKYMELDYALIEKSIKAIFARKGDAVVASNLATLKAGRDFADAQ